MIIIDILRQSIHNYIELMSRFFLWYNGIGRKMLDFLHIVFQNIFDFLLVVAVFVSALYLVMSIYAIFRKKKDNKEEEISGTPFVTVQIPTFNEPVAIRCAKSCLDFDYPKDKYEILIGDDSNNPEVSRKLKEFADGNEPVRVIKRDSNAGYKPGNLNNMLKHSKGEILVIFDSDFVPDKDFLSRIVKPFMKDRKIAGVQARWKLINANQNMISSLGATIVSTYHHIAIPFTFDKQGIVFLCGSAEAVRKSTLVELGGWENGNLTEDIEFSLRLLEKGYKIEYLDELECDGEVPYTLKDLYRQQMRWAYGVIYSWKNHFKGIVKSRHLTFMDKLHMQGIFLSGYLLSVLLAGLFITGTLSFVTHAPAPIEWGRLIYELARNIALTSGLIIASTVALAKANKLKLTLPMIASSFSYGLVVTYYVNVGIFKALAKTPMEWYMLNKQGNKIY
ncbi:glycosyltransferase [Candidatus Woesearchaeota archaeon]|nr:glycosyltransferase [Candidatus Woesearchaeota archaeon]